MKQKRPSRLHTGKLVQGLQSLFLETGKCISAEELIFFMPGYQISHIALKPSFLYPAEELCLSGPLACLYNHHIYTGHEKKHGMPYQSKVIVSF